MAYTKRLEVKINGTALLWDVDPDDVKIKIKDVTGFEMTAAQLENVETLLKQMVSTCKSCPDIKSFEYSDIIQEIYV